MVPGHKDIIGNEEADKLAKLATALDPPYLSLLSFAYINLLISAQKFNQWSNLLIKYSENHLISKGYIDSYSRTFPWYTTKSIKLPKGTLREIASSYFQLKIGHGYNKRYLHRLSHVTNNKCRCGAIESPEYLLLAYSLYKE